MKRRLPSWLREPLLLWFVMGGLVFFAYRWFAADASVAIELTAAGRAVLLQEFAMLTGREATEADAQAELRRYYEREVLFREALRDGLHSRDAEVREVLIERMQQQVSGALPEPDDRLLVGFYADNLSRYYSEATLTLTQVFYREAPAEPEAILLALEERAQRPAANEDTREAWAQNFANLGDTPWQGRHFPDYGASMLRGLFGEELLRAMQDLPERRWSGPFMSADGWHFFYVSDRRAPRPLDFARVREQVRIDYQSALLQERIDTFVNARRDRYPFIVDDAP